jgi:pSer/pThr/pTyr-binding forkhead associated (FHA) protein
VGADVGKTFAVVGSPVRLGYGEMNEIQLTDEAVSTQHCVLEETEKGYRIRDLGSTNGTRLNGVPVVEAFLPPGAEIWLGDSRLRFQPRRPT